MQVLRWSAAAALAAMVSMTPSFANDELSAMKASMENMKVEMDAMRATMAAERDALRSNAGGAPEALQSANGNATIRIGGDVRVQYGMSWSNGYGRVSSVNGSADANFKSTRAGWAVSRAALNFDIELSCDTSAQVALRFDEQGAFDGANANILDQAWWKWDNVGGTGFGLKIGLQDMPFGMWANTDMGGYDFDGVDRALITNPFVRGGGDDTIYNINNVPGAGVDGNVTTLGVVASYNWDEQIVLKAGIMANGIMPNGNSVWANDPGLLYNNENRNMGFVDHVVTLGYNPCWLEGLHIEAGYMGRFDGAEGTIAGFGLNNPYGFDRVNPGFTSDNNSYTPSFDLGVNYKINDQWNVYAEGVMTWRPDYQDGMTCALTTGVDYRFTEKLMFGAGFEWANSCIDEVTRTDEDAYGNLYRLTLGGKYDFGNGLYFQAQYYHDMLYTAGAGFRDQNMKDADVILFQTGYQF